MDTICIKDLSVRCIIGTRPEERVVEQEVLVNIELECDLAIAGKSDDLDDTVNYSALRHQLISAAVNGQYLLIERLADELARICLHDARVAAVTVTVDKPCALEEARSVAVRIHRTTEDSEIA